jgi:hypothetical protein
MLLKNSILLEEEFLKAFSDLMSVKMPAKQCLEVSSSIDEISAQFNIVIRARKSIADKYCKRNEKGDPSLDSNGNIEFESEDFKKKCFEEIYEILEEGIDISLTSKIRIKNNEMMTPKKFKMLSALIELVD